MSRRQTRIHCTFLFMKEVSLPLETLEYEVLLHLCTVIKLKHGC